VSAVLRFEGLAHGAAETVEAPVDTLVIAGWTGRDAAAIEHHIAELAALGVPRPSRVPLYYRVAASLLTQADRVEMLGPDSSGEVEPILIGAADRLWVSIASDHTDRKVESYSVAVSKQLCAKPCARTAWRFEEVAEHWDRLMLRSFVVEDGRRTLYQEGALAAIRPPRDLIAGFAGSKRLPRGTAMLCGTLAARGGVRSAPRFEMELEDPVLGRAIRHGYDIAPLPVVA
jgi:hypothetical protein